MKNEEWQQLLCRIKNYRENLRRHQQIIRVAVVLFFLSNSTFAQLVAVPNPPHILKNNDSNARIGATLVQLPFFDDFSITKASPDVSLWLVGGGTYISNTATIDHPSVNVVVFDGTQADGRPYVFNNPSAEGTTDTLTSQPIDLGGLVAKDSIYLSFYWRAKGLGEVPDASDFLKLQLRDSTGKWQDAWSNRGGLLIKKIMDKDTTYEFQNQFINHLQKIDNRLFLYKGFQFRFLAVGRQSGRFDTWFIDYVYLNKKRSYTDRFSQDVAAVSAVESLLKRYSAMPLKQFLLKPDIERADSLKFTIRNLNNGPNPIRQRIILKDSTRKLIEDSTTTPFFIPSLSGYTFKTKIPSFTIQAGAAKTTLNLKFEVITTDNVNTKIQGIDLRRNDTLSSQTVLDNYYAYDDGTAEYAVYMNKSLGRTAVRFILNRNDLVGGVKMNLTPILRDISGQNFTIFVWNNINGKPSTVAHQEVFKVKYPDNRDGFIDFPFKNGVAVSDTFYVGWVQIGQDPIAVGLDRNNARSSNIFINLGQQWEAFNSGTKDSTVALFEGSLLLRPYLGGALPATVTATPVEESDDWSIYPNPTDGIIRWKANDIKQVDVFSIGGNTMLNYQHTYEKQIDISTLPSGKYLIRLSNDKHSVIHKVLKL